MRIPQVSGVRKIDNQKIYGYLSVLDRYDKYFIFENMKIIKDGLLPIHEVFKSSIIIEDCLNLSFDIPVKSNNGKLEDLKRNIWSSNG